MKTSHLLSGLVLITAVITSGCESADFQTIAASPRATESSAVPTPSVPEGGDVVLPSSDAPTDENTTDTSGETTTDPVPEEPVEEPFVSPTGPDCYRYAFVSTRNGYENIYSASTCSKEAPTQVTRNTIEESQFRNLQISNDGKKATYDYVNLANGDWFMAIEDIANLGSGGENIGGCRSAALSPSNDRVVYVCASSGLHFTELRDLSLTRLIAPGTPDTRVFENAVWSPVTTETDPSHDKVVFSAKEAGGSDEFYVYDAKTTRKTRPLYELYNGNGHNVMLRGSSADISPDGKTLTFVRKNTFGGQEQIWACDLMFDQVVVSENALSTSAPRFPTATKESLCVNPRILTSEGNNASPHWTSNGKHIFFSSDRDGNKEIYVMKADGSEEANLTQGSASDRDVAPFPALRPIDDIATPRPELSQKL